MKSSHESHLRARMKRLGSAASKPLALLSDCTVVVSRSSSSPPGAGLGRRGAGGGESGGEVRERASLGGEVCVWVKSEGPLVRVRVRGEGRGEGGG